MFASFSFFFFLYEIVSKFASIYIFIPILRRRCTFFFAVLLDRVVRNVLTRRNSVKKKERRKGKKDKGEIENIDSFVSASRVTGSLSVSFVTFLSCLFLSHCFPSLPSFHVIFYIGPFLLA